MPPAHVRAPILFFIPHPGFTPRSTLYHPHMLGFISTAGACPPAMLSPQGDIIVARGVNPSFGR